MNYAQGEKRKREGEGEGVAGQQGTKVDEGGPNKRGRNDEGFPFVCEESISDLSDVPDSTGGSVGTNPFGLGEVSDPGVHHSEGEASGKYQTSFFLLFIVVFYSVVF